jgi:hypothetical protein
VVVPFDDPSFLAEKRELMVTTVAAGEDVRYVQLDARRRRMVAAASGRLIFAQDYMYGLRTGNPRASFWSIIDPHGQVQAFYSMNYSQGEFTGGPMYQGDIPPPALAWHSYWRRLFEKAAP